jgi:hypothetical protein
VFAIWEHVFSNHVFIIRFTGVAVKLNIATDRRPAINDRPEWASLVNQAEEKHGNAKSLCVIMAGWDGDKAGFLEKVK